MPREHLESVSLDGWPLAVKAGSAVKMAEGGVVDGLYGGFEP